MKTDKIIKFDADNFEEDMLKQKIGQLMIKGQLVIDNPYNKTDKRIADTNVLFNNIKNKNGLDGNILIIDEDAKQMIARFISYYQCCFLGSGSVTVWSSKIKPHRYYNIEFVEKEVCYEQEDFSNFDFVIARNPQGKLVEALTSMVKQDVDFYIETEFPWGIERFEARYLELLCDTDPEFVYTSAMDKLYKYILSMNNDVEQGYMSSMSNNIGISDYDSLVTYFCRSKINTVSPKNKAKILNFKDFKNGIVE